LHARLLATALRNQNWQLEELPLLQRGDLRREFPDGLTSSDIELRPLLASGDVVIAGTSGSSGERLQVFSDTRMPRLPPDIDPLWQLPGLEGDGPIRTAVFTSATCSGTLCTTGHKPYAQRLVQEHTLLLESPQDAFALTREEVERTLTELNLFQPQLLFGNPVYLRMLAQQAQRYGLSVPRPRAIVLSYQLATSAMRRSLQAVYAAPIFDMYSATELGGSQIAISCSYGRLHVRLDHVYVELLNAAGNPVERGALGEVTVTTHNPIMPLCRYALRDLARFELAPCPCPVGSSWPSLRLEGRARDAFSHRGRYVTAREVGEALNLEMFQLRELRPREFELSVVGESVEPSLSALHALLEPRALTLRHVEQLSLDQSQKFRFTVPYGE
jgi:phenylacetate-coenzyme A ligase PaaK-like adenylate-forming protein